MMLRRSFWLGVLPVLAVACGGGTQPAAPVADGGPTDDAPATQVTFNVTHDAENTVVNDRGSFSKGVPIEHLFDAFSGTYDDGPATCAVAAITFAAGHRWTAPGGGTPAY